MNQFILLTLGERVGFYEFTRHIIILIDDDQAPEDFAETYAKTFYGGESESVGGWYSFHGGEVAVWVKSVKTLTPAEAAFLKNFIEH